MKKRILPALLALCMVMSLLPVAFAGDEPAQTEDKTCAGTAENAEDCKADPGTHKPGCAAYKACGLGGCTLDNEHEGKHNNTACKKFSEDVCGAATHEAGCASKCTFANCTLTAEHNDGAEKPNATPHNNTVCPGTADETRACAASTHTDACSQKCQCTNTKLHTGDWNCQNTVVKGENLCASCKASTACTPCTTSDDESCVAGTHETGCDMKCYFCTNTKGSTEVTVKVNNKDTKVKICATCAADASKNPCGAGAKEGKGGCTLVKGHTEKHNSKNCTNDIFCAASKHEEACANACKHTVEAKAGWVKKEDGSWDKETAPKGVCTLTKGHEKSGVPHNIYTVCTTAKDCSATEHFPGVHAKKTDKDGNPTTEDDLTKWEEGKEPCKALATAKACGKGKCTLPAGHIGMHNNTVCLGNDADSANCNTAKVEKDGKQVPVVAHIAGCKQYVKCTCGDGHTYAEKKDGTEADVWKNHAAFAASAKCTGKADCVHCTEWNNFVDEMYAQWEKQDKEYKEDQAAGGTSKKAPSPFDLVKCTCVACSPANQNPVSGVVDTETTDPANPSTDPETPTKAEDFTDMEAWMAADVQVVLDNGWMNGMNNGKFEGREDTTGQQVATVIARMLGADVKSGAEWQPSLQTWIDANADLLEGIEITSGAMARKDVILMLWRQADKPDSDFELEFDDVDGLEGDYLTAMKWAAEKGIVKGNGDGTVTPDGNVKRAELAAFAARYYALEK